jgi:sec-independent protein translocase protein TatA
MIGTLGWQELLIILVILALIFGASRVSDLGGALGRGIREFRQESRNEDDENEEEKDEPETAQASSQSSSDGDRSESSG